MTTPRVAELIGVLDSETRALLGLQVRGVPGAAGAVALTGLGAVDTVAGVTPVAKDIPVADLKTALGIPAGVIGTVKKVAGLDPDGAGAISKANLQGALDMPFTVAGVAAGAGAWGAKDVPVASLRTALGLPFTVAGVAGSGWAGDVAAASLVTALSVVQSVAGVSGPTISAAGLRTALGLPFTVAGVAASGWAGDVDVVALAAAIAAQSTAARSMTWAQHITAGNGTYDGQRRRILVTAGGPNQVFEIEWNSITSSWGPPNGRMLIHVGVIQTDTNSTGTQNLTGTAFTTPAGMFRPSGAAGVGALGMEMEVQAETSISATARTVIAQLDATANIVNPLAAIGNRRVGARWGFIPTDATHGFSLTKADANEYDFPQGANTNIAACDRTWANAIAVSLAIQFTTAASAATATLRRYKCYLVTG